MQAFRWRRGSPAGSHRPSMGWATTLERRASWSIPSASQSSPPFPVSSVSSTSNSSGVKMNWPIWTQLEGAVPGAGFSTMRSIWWSEPGLKAMEP